MKIVCLAAVGFVNMIVLPPVDAQVAPCSQRMPIIWSLQFAAPLDQWLEKLSAYRIWGTQNLAVRQDGPKKVLEVTYPEGSIDPATTTVPEGGAGFLYPLSSPLFSGWHVDIERLTWGRFDDDFRCLPVALLAPVPGSPRVPQLSLGCLTRQRGIQKRSRSFLSDHRNRPAATDSLRASPAQQPLGKFTV